MHCYYSATQPVEGSNCVQIVWFASYLYVISLLYVVTHFCKHKHDELMWGFLGKRRDNLTVKVEMG
jgi:hypothetical protein